MEIPLILAGGLIFAACGEPSRSVPAQRPVAATVVAARYETVSAELEAPGTVQPRNRVVLSAQINGFVKSVSVRAGDTVSAGQVLATLDAREAESQKDAAQASVQEAQAALDEARKGARAAASMRDAARANSELAASTLQRLQKLFDSKSLSPQELDEARTRRDAALADLAARETMASAAEDRLRGIEARISQATAQSKRADVIVGWTVVKAPVAGRIVERSVDPGSAIFPGNPLVVIETTANPQVLAELPTAQLSALHAGMEVYVRISDSAAAIKGRIAEIVPLSNPATHTVQFKVDLPAGFSAPSGAFARTLVPAGTRNALLIPAKAVRETGQLSGIFVVDSGSRARFRLVRTAPFDEERVELLSGLEPGEKVVSVITEELTDGIAVEVRS